MKTVLWTALFFTWLGSGLYGHLQYSKWSQSRAQIEDKTSLYLRQFENDDNVPQAVRTSHWADNTIRDLVYGFWGFLGLGLVCLPIAGQIEKFKTSRQGE